jgi:hypothetical protein
MIWMDRINTNIVQNALLKDSMFVSSDVKDTGIILRYPGTYPFAAGKKVFLENIRKS